MFLCFQFTTDLGSGGESVKKIETKTFVGSAALNTAKTELTTVRLLLDEICHYFFSLLYQEFWSIDFLFWIWPCHLVENCGPWASSVVHLYDYNVFIEIYKGLCGKRNVIFSG